MSEANAAFCFLVEAPQKGITEGNPPVFFSPAASLPAGLNPEHT